MFVVSEDQNRFLVGEENVLSLLQSMNEPMIAAADHAAEETQAFVVINRADKKQVQVCIVLHLKASNGRVVYEWDEGAVEESDRSEVEEEALDFVENMGFMMDSLGIEKLSPDQKKEVLGDLPIFHSKEKAKFLSGETLDKLDSLEDDSELPFADLEEDFERKEGADILSDDSQAELLNLTALEEFDEALEPLKPASRAADPELVLPDAEFERGDSDFDQELDAVVAILDKSTVSQDVPMSRKQSQKEAGSVGADNSQEAWLRLLASF